MSFAAVPVVMANPVEQGVIKHGETGFVCESLTEMVKVVRLLQNDPNLRLKMGVAAQNWAQQNLPIEHCSQRWSQFIDEVASDESNTLQLNLPSFADFPMGSPAQLCLASYNPQTRFFLLSVLRGNNFSAAPPGLLSLTKGSPFITKN